MFSLLLKQIKISLLLLVLLTVLTGLIYPFLVTGIAQLFFPYRANGSLIVRNDRLVGSDKIGQAFTDRGYFWGRPSATSPFPYNAAASSGSNLAPTNPALLQAIQKRIAQLHAADPDNTQLVPIDLVTASGSGLDPEISPLAAYYQIHRIAVARHLPEPVLRDLVKRFIQPRQFHLLGEPRVNVLELNMALDQMISKRKKS